MDFHACRVAFVTFVVESGVTVKEAQALARHESPEITMNTYARARDERLSEAAEAIGALVEPGQIYDTGMTRVAAGAEGLSPNKKAPKACAKGARVEAAGIEPVPGGCVGHDTTCTGVLPSSAVADLHPSCCGAAATSSVPTAR